MIPLMAEQTAIGRGMVGGQRDFTVRAMAIEAVLLGFLPVGYQVKRLVKGIDRQGSGCFVGSEQ
ncbi:hypothetical protein DPPLL_15620 [Desulfofustis limnaeus]|uniref:Uncharacterized protein n=1 Tax=Desulfofustis limnaeus TaxID=2740163 RepID=A0ABM7W8B9_9BACT|nr:hypothetical protein DPPLL_15620 [Desulfofustis limnaeus]